MIKKVSFLALVLLISCYTLKGQIAGLTGKVVDLGMLEPIPFANVVIEDSNKYIAGVITDIDGNYLIKPLKVGNYTVKVSFLGYETSIIKDVIIKRDSVTTLDIKLVASAVKIEGVVITKYKVPLIDKDRTVSGASVTSEEISRPPTEKKAAGVSVKSSRDESGKIEEKSISDPEDWVKPDPGQLTASELNDFSKWDLWQDIRKNDLKKFQSIWKISPESRYSVQVRANDGQPVADAVVLLKSSVGEVIWSAKTDNTGKAELWSNLFQESKPGKVTLTVVYGNVEYPYTSPNLINKGINTLKIPVTCNNPDTVDIAFVVDATGSMGDEMNYLKAELLDIINKETAKSNGLAINVGSVFYRDHGDVYVTRKSDFSTELSETLSFISLQKAESGGDYEEAVEEGLSEAVENLVWSKNARARILFLLLDAPPHSNSGVIKKLQHIIEIAAQKGIRIIPIIASGETSGQGASLEYLMRSIALATNGTYVFLTDHSKIGNVHAKPVTDQYDVELLNNLLKRLIVQYTYMPKCGEELVGIEKSDTSYFINSPIIAHEILDLSKTRTPFIPLEIVQDFTKQLNTDSTNAIIVEDSISIPVVEESIQNSELPEIKYYPNPTKGIITVEIKGKVEELYLTDISGKLIKKIKINGETSMNIDLSDYSSGIYFLKYFAQNNSFTGKILLSH